MKSAAQTLYEAELEKQVWQRDKLIRELLSQVKRLINIHEVSDESIKKSKKFLKEVDKFMRDKKIK